MGKSPEDRKFIKIPQTKNTVRQNILLAAGLLLVLAGIFLFVKTFASVTKVFALRPVVFLCAGAVFIFLALAFTKNSIFFFLGITSVLFGIISILTDTGITPLSMKELWPTFVIACGISLFPAGFYKMKRVRTVYLFPAIMLVLLGSLFLMFSLHIIKMPFSRFIAFTWPIFIMLFGLTLVVIFLWQQTHHKNFPYMVDDSVENDNDPDDDDTIKEGGDNN